MEKLEELRNKYGINRSKNLLLSNNEYSLCYSKWLDIKSDILSDIRKFRKSYFLVDRENEIDGYREYCLQHILIDDYYDEFFNWFLNEEDIGLLIRMIPKVGRKGRVKILEYYVVEDYIMEFLDCYEEVKCNQFNKLNLMNYILVVFEDNGIVIRGINKECNKEIHKEICEN